MIRFSKVIRPESKVIGLECSDKDLMVTAVRNPDETIAVVVFNEGDTAKNFELILDKKM